MHHSSASSTSTTDLLTKPRNGLNPRGDCPTDILRLRTRYIITVIPVLNVNAGDDCIHAAAALIQSPPLAPAPAPVRPTPCPKERALFGANNKSQNGDAAHKGRCFSIPRIPINARVFPPPSPSRCAGTRAGTRQSTQEINLSISKFTVAEHNKCRERSGRRTWPLALAHSTLLQVLLFPAFQCAVRSRGSNKGRRRTRT